MKRELTKNNKVSGFTIVELLIVIVIIGILAAITIVSYTGISARAKTARAQSNANSVMNVAHVYNIDPRFNVYPDQGQLAGFTGGSAKLPTGVTIAPAGLNALRSDNAETTIVYLNKGTTGGCIGYYDVAATSVPVKYLYVGNATTANLNVAGPSCL